MVDTVKKSRVSRAEAFEKWADSVESDDLKEAATSALRSVAEFAVKRREIDEELAVAVRVARRAGRSWSEIGAMLGVSKQAAQRKYGPISATS